MGDKVKRKIVSHLGQVDYSEMKVPMAVIYDHPADVPDKFVVRLWEASTGKPTNIEVRKDTLNEARKAIAHSMRMPVHLTRAESDDPTIVEMWI